MVVATMVVATMVVATNGCSNDGCSNDGCSDCKSKIANQPLFSSFSLFSLL